MTGTATGAVSAAEMARLMAAFDPFEPRPLVAAAVSGGADSTALALLLQAWAHERDGRVLALVVDHALRSGSAAEAAEVQARLSGLGLEARVLTATGPAAGSNRQAAAREARYRLLLGECRDRGILHLVLAHHREDQAETLLLRLARGSGLDGLAAMPALREAPHARLLRPLLAVPRSRLRATLERHGVTWIEDPSNQDESFDRVRMRRLAPRLAPAGLSAGRLASAAGNLGRARGALERATDRLVAAAVTLDPAGFAWLRPEAFAAAPEEAARRALGRVLAVLGGSVYPPRGASLDRLLGRLRDGTAKGATLAGCRVVPRRGRLLVAREPRTLSSRPIRPGENLRWDGRFEVALGDGTAGGGAAPGVADLQVGPLGRGGWQEISGSLGAAEAARVPPLARPALPALRDGVGVLAVPHVKFERSGAAAGTALRCRFVPELALTQGPFAVA